MEQELSRRHQDSLSAFAAASEKAVSDELIQMGKELKDKSKEVQKLQKKVRDLKTALEAKQAEHQRNYSTQLEQV